MNASQDVWTHPQDAAEIRKLRLHIDELRDFIEWLFDNPYDEGIHWISESEAWDLCNKHQKIQFPQQ